MTKEHCEFALTFFSGLIKGTPPNTKLHTSAAKKSDRTTKYTNMQRKENNR